MRTRGRGALIACLLWCLYAPALVADSYPRQPAIDVQHYIFRVVVTGDTEEIAGEATITLRFVADGVTQFALDLASPADGKGMSVTNVTSDAGAVKFRHQADRLTITLDAAPKAGESRRFTVQYHGVPADGLHVAGNRFGERIIYSANWPDLARQWLPTIDHPYDKATSEFIVTAPSRYQVVSNGLLAEEIDLGDGRRSTHWKQSVPIASWLNTIEVAQFASRHFGTAAGVPLQLWLFPRDRDAGLAAFQEPTRQAISFYSDRIGPYPYEKLAGVEAPGIDGGMEHASAVLYGEKTIIGRFAFGFVAHETAHQWFGDSVTENDWDDVWLSEGFATYFALLCAEHYQGHDAFVAGLKRSRAAIFAAQKKLPAAAVIADKPWKGIPNPLVYQKGAWTLHQLRGLIGTDKFWAGIREYYRRYRDGNASTGDFRNVMEEASGADLGWFFRQWLYRAGFPVVAGGWRYNPQSKSIEIELEQTHPGDPYRLPLDVGVSVEGARPGIERIELTAGRQRFEIPADKEPSAVELDPDTWTLMDARFARR